MGSLALYEIAHQYQALERLAESDELPAELIADTLEGLTGDFETKAVAVAQFIRSLETNSKAVAMAAAAMNARASRIAARADSIRAYLLFWMQATDIKRIESPELVLTRRTNPPALLVTDEVAIPEQFWVQPEPPPKRLDRKAIKKAIEDGMQISGAYVEAAERLEIRN